MQDRLKKLRASKGKSELGKVTLEQAIGGMRGIPVGPSGLVAHRCLLLWTSLSIAHAPANSNKNPWSHEGDVPALCFDQSGMQRRWHQAAAGCGVVFATGT